MDATTLEACGGQAAVAREALTPHYAQHVFVEADRVPDANAAVAECPARLAEKLVRRRSVKILAFARTNLTSPMGTVGLWAGGRHPAGEVLSYIVAQVLGGIVGAGMLYLIASGKAGFDGADGLASNGYGDHSPGLYSMGSSFVTEVVMTLMFLLIILGATDRRAPAGFAPIIGVLIAGNGYRWLGRGQ